MLSRFLKQHATNGFVDGGMLTRSGERQGVKFDRVGDEDKGTDITSVSFA